MGRPRKISSSGCIASPDAVTSPLTGRRAAWLQVEVYAGDGPAQASRSGSMRTQVRLGDRLLVRTRRGTVAVPMQQASVYFAGEPQASAVLPQGAARPAHPAFEQGWPADGPVRCIERRLPSGSAVRLSATVTLCSATGADAIWEAQPSLGPVQLTVHAPRRSRHGLPHTRSLVLAVALLGAFLLLGLLVGPMSDRRELAYIERTTGVVWPQDLDNVSVFDTGSRFITAHVTLQRKDVEDFRKNNGLFPCDEEQGEAFRLDELLLGAEKLDAPYRAASDGAELLCAAGSTKGHAWQYVLDPSTASVWVTLQYRPAAGEPP